MGGRWSSDQEPPNATNEIGVSELPEEGKAKRSRRSLEPVEEETHMSAKRRKIQATSEYIYDTLFRKGTGSDITITALGSEWKLHKVYLGQSAYFASMFSGHWRESNQSEISLDIPDPNITSEALDLAFSSLYTDAIVLEPSKVLGTIAVATMLHLEGLLEHCREFMKETFSSDHIIPYLTAASLYGLQDIERDCRFWLKVNLMTASSVPLLRDMSPELLKDLISSSDLFVMQVEMDVYSLTKKWLYLKLNPEWTGDFSQLTNASDQFFKKSSVSGGCSSDDGEMSPLLQQYKPVLRAIRLQHVIADSASVTVLESENIIPKGWLTPLYRHQWLSAISVDQALDDGPSRLTPEEFDLNAVRCGRVLNEPGDYCWRWTGYSFGVDILILFSGGLISIKRNTHSQPCLASVSLRNQRAVTFRLRVMSFAQGGEVCCSQDSGIVNVSLNQDETYSILTVSKQAQFPLFISFYMMLISKNATIGS